ncbi:hypothetical protein FPQ18DRAFT_397069 [Pyronema domesticum]|nr:hypothetical protein FPQ18DRAFT_397069 [Pyronema domesticum]
MPSNDSRIKTLNRDELYETHRQKTANPPGTNLYLGFKIKSRPKLPDDQLPMFISAAEANEDVRKVVDFFNNLTGWDEGRDWPDEGSKLKEEKVLVGKLWFENFDLDKVKNELVFRFNVPEKEEEIKEELWRNYVRIWVAERLTTTKKYKDGKWAKMFPNAVAPKLWAVRLRQRTEHKMPPRNLSCLSTDRGSDDGSDNGSDDGSDEGSDDESDEESDDRSGNGSDDESDDGSDVFSEEDTAHAALTIATVADLAAAATQDSQETADEEITEAPAQTRK